ncbi:hypothetical protein [Pseudoflavitalea rhizosphaerae]|uniref:hypothetical protein n=1 Tax=Pseudoflavitalea rhizosphaerae TaxID=1884793 RepID=UPI000F8EB619|nr:hypothetical protein [Pseudoflavitalea rhizosphaerae]
MWSTYHFEICLLGGILILVIYFLILKRARIIKLNTAGSQRTSLPNRPIAYKGYSLIDPIENFSSAIQSTMAANFPVGTEYEGEIEPEDWNDIELTHVDEVSFLMREADYVVEKIQDVLAHIASNPPNPEEVTSKVSAIVQPYRIFFDTEYYNSINAYISLAVERDCGIQLSKANIESLWFKSSA